MKIKKLGHCCFIVEPKDGVRIMTDPGAFSTLQNEEKNISLVLITHEHGDHLHIDSLKNILENNPDCMIITNTSVGVLLEKEGIVFTKVEEGETYPFKGVAISGFGNVHAEIYDDYGRVQNTGYMIDSLCYPGDAFYYPDSHVDILALPVCGPWMKTKEAVIYAKTINPRIVFPVHDGMLIDSFPVFWNVPKHFLSEENIPFKKLELGKEEEV